MGVRHVKSLMVMVALLTTLASGAAACNVACPMGLATGVLVRAGDRLDLANGTGATSEVVWPDGYGVRQDSSGLVLTDRFGTIKGT